jgi:hypothetical protein
MQKPVTVFSETIYTVLLGKVSIFFTKETKPFELQFFIKEMNLKIDQLISTGINYYSIYEGHHPLSKFCDDSRSPKQLVVFLSLIVLPATFFLNNKLELSYNYFNAIQNEW